jgi:hypothetical protein
MKKRMRFNFTHINEGLPDLYDSVLVVVAGDTFIRTAIYDKRNSAGIGFYDSYSQLIHNVQWWSANKF